MNNNPLTDIQRRVLEIISDRGKANPVTGAQLSRSVVNTLRDKGYPICASSEGYYYPQKPEELADYILQFTNRIKQQERARDALVDRLNGWMLLLQKSKEVESPIKPAQDQLFKFNGRLD